MGRREFERRLSAGGRRMFNRATSGRQGGNLRGRGIAASASGGTGRSGGLMHVNDPLRSNQNHVKDHGFCYCRFFRW